MNSILIREMVWLLQLLQEALSYVQDSPALLVALRLEILDSLPLRPKRLLLTLRFVTKMKKSFLIISLFLLCVFPLLGYAARIDSPGGGGSTTASDVSCSDCVA